MVIGIADKKEHSAAISKTGTQTETFVVGEIATKEIDVGAELGEQLLLQDLAGLLARGVDEIELDMDEGTDVVRRMAELTLEHDEPAIVEGCEGTYSIGVAALGALHL